MVTEKTIKKWIKTLELMGYVILSPDQIEKCNQIYRNNGNIFLGELTGILDFIQDDEGDK